MVCAIFDPEEGFLVARFYKAIGINSIHPQTFPVHPFRQVERHWLFPD